VAAVMLRPNRRSDRGDVHHVVVGSGALQHRRLGSANREMGGGVSVCVISIFDSGNVKRQWLGLRCRWMISRQFAALRKEQEARHLATSG